MTTEASHAVAPAIMHDRPFGLVIDGQVCSAASGETRAIVDPSTGMTVAHVPEAGPRDVERAVEAAARAQPEWAGLGVRGRRSAFETLAELVVEHREPLAAIDAVDSGNPLRAMRTDIDISVANIRDWPGLALGLAGDTIPASRTGLHYTRYEPYGVVGRIVAFNHPAMFAMTRILAALIAGNTVVLKPGVQTPLAALEFGRLAQSVLPPGVLNVLSGGAPAGDALVTNPAVRRIGFTGSVPTGLTIQRRAAEAGHITSLSLELGGKNAMVVLPDANVDDVVEGAIHGMNLEVCQGQSCGSNSRILVHRAAVNNVVEGLRDRMRRIRVGPAVDDDATMGPLVSADHLDRVRAYVHQGIAEGARLVTGGGRPSNIDEGGFFLEPTLFADADMSMTIAREEIFGPVVTVIAYDDIDEAVALANDVDYGLTASVWTHDLDLAHTTAHRLRAGYVWINDSSTHYWGTPFGGMKDSGLGREESIEELRSYLETQVVHTMLTDPQAAWQRICR